MKDERMPWFACFPTKLLGALAGMKPDDGYLYCVVLLRIYEVGGPCPDTLDALSRRVGFNRRRVTDALDRLFKSEKLYRDPAGLMNRQAADSLSARSRLRDELSEHGKEGATRRWKKHKENQSSNRGHPSQTPPSENADLQLQLQDTPPNGGVSAPKPKREKPKSKISPDWQLSSADAAFAGERGFHGQTVRALAERFKNRHQAQGTLSADWGASWRTWVLNEIKFNAERNQRLPPARGPSLIDIALGRPSDGQ